METRVQFRIEAETKALAKKSLSKKGLSLSDALRTFLERLASTEKIMTKEDIWLKEQIEETFLRVDSGDVKYFSEDEADERMNNFISNIEHRHESV
jgi:antitoxin component of RelBE/YafQ-DinJ toxin-antitoxin module